jgi:hypothetical protein
MQQQQQCLSVSMSTVSLGSRRGGYGVLVCCWDKQPLGTMAVQVRSLPIPILCLFGSRKGGHV